ncbi:MAG TPA: FtsX-like permease family protein [Ktedonobacterales bacterium]|nr:FtsX-like permease family protein [Ktedonobacterales bacterium]
MQPPYVPHRPTFKAPVQRTGSAAFRFHLERIQRNIADRPGRALSVAVAVAVGVSIAIAIIAASNGINTKISDLLPSQSAPGPDGQAIDIPTIHEVLVETRDLLTRLAIGFTAVLVGLITWVTMGQRRRDIGIALQQGEHRSTIIWELLGEALILCVVGGILGIILGVLLCNILQSQIPLLPLQPSVSDMLGIFPVTTLLSFGVTGIVAAFLISRRDTSVGL